jgi:drug/metabolite transporter (DMT)-like permease
MNDSALVMVLVAAVLHASWNAIVKGAGDRAVAMAAVAFAHVVVGGVALGFVVTPERASWPFIAASALIHYAYYAFLFLSYRFGDLSHVYPIARGVAPMLVALGALVFAGETLVPKAWGGVVAVSLGIGILALRRNGALAAERSAVLAALATGLMIASYSVVDGIGIRLSGAPAGYIAWIFFLEFPITLGVLALRGRGLATLPWRAVAIAFSGGLLSVLAYGLVLYAKTMAPLAAVSAVRESSVIIAALIGVVVFGERPWGRRVLAATIVALGVILLATANQAQP